MPKIKTPVVAPVEPVEEVVVEEAAVDSVSIKPKGDTWVPPSVQHEIAISTPQWIEVWNDNLFTVVVNNDGHVLLRRKDGNGEMLLGVLELDVTSLTETMLHLHAKRVAALTLSMIRIR